MLRKFSLLLLIATFAHGCAAYKAEYARQMALLNPPKPITKNLFLSGNQNGILCQITLEAAEGESSGYPTADLLIKNNGNTPIRTNMFTDKFHIADDRGTIYEIGIIDSLSKYQSQVVNPGDNSFSRIHPKSKSVKDAILNGTIKAGLCTIGSANTKVELRRRNPTTGEII